MSKMLSLVVGVAVLTTFSNAGANPPSIDRQIHTFASACTPVWGGYNGYLLDQYGYHGDEAAWLNLDCSLVHDGTFRLFQITIHAYDRNCVAGGDVFGTVYVENSSGQVQYSTGTNTSSCSWGPYANSITIPEAWDNRSDFYYRLLVQLPPPDMGTSHFTAFDTFVDDL